MKVFICQTCGHIEFNSAPEACPVCASPKDKFDKNDNIFRESEEKSKEAAVKHIPDVNINRNCVLIPDGACTDILVRIGKTIHPMEEKHFIQFIDCYVDEVYSGRAMFSPKSSLPAACFHLKVRGGKVTIVENCNIHGYWMAEAIL